jgi:YD repeat-containing protein
VGVATTLWSILAASPAAADLTYIYDGLSRLRAVVDPAADTAIYSYDAVGNLLAITRQPSSQVTLIEFPPSGVAGSCGVLLQGTGFDPIAANNTVTVNGVTATVQAATATQITICVPAGATSGPIAVTTPAGSSTSSTAITVAADSGAPTITGLDPIIGTPGTSVTITGSQFDPEPARNNVLFNRVGFAALGTVTSAVIGTTVPLRVGSGPVSVTTSAGTAFSPMDFFVPPAPYGVADVVVMGRMTVGGTSTTVTIPTVNKIGLILFDGDFGQRVSLGVSSVTAQSYVKILNPDGTTLVTSGLITTTEGAVDSPPLPATGTYTAFVDPFGAATGSVTLTLSDEVTGTLTAGGASVVLSINRPGQRARYTFSGTAGQRLSLGVSSVTIPNLYVTIVNPDGTTLITSSQITTTGGAVDPPPLPTTGTYSVLVDPNAAFTGNATLTLSEELTGTLTVNGPVLPITARAAGAPEFHRDDRAAVESWHLERDHREPLRDDLQPGRDDADGFEPDHDNRRDHGSAAAADHGDLLGARESQRRPQRQRDADPVGRAHGDAHRQRAVAAPRARARRSERPLDGRGDGRAGRDGPAHEQHRGLGGSDTVEAGWHGADHLDDLGQRLQPRHPDAADHRDLHGHGQSHGHQHRQHHRGGDEPMRGTRTERDRCD